MDIKRELLTRVYFLMLLFVIGAGVLFYAAVKISVLEGDKWKEMGESLYLRYIPTEADRGNVLASDGSFLATSLPFFDIRMDLKADGMTQELFDQNIDSLAFMLSTYVNPSRSAYEYRQLLTSERKKGNRYLLLKRKATFSEMRMIRSFPLLREGANVGGFIAERKSERQRPFGELGARTVGINRENEPIGIEGSFDEELRGEEGRKLMKRVGRGIWVPVSDLSEIEPRKGSDIYTTLDVNIQDIAHNALKSGLEHYHADKGVAIVMEVKTGAVRAISNLQKASDGTFRESYNHAIGTGTEPGSTMKTASVLALLETKSVDQQTKVSLGGGKKRYYDRWMYDSKMHGIHESDLRYAFTHSSNVGVSAMVSKYFGTEPSKFVDYLKVFGMNTPCYIEIEGEVAPFIKEAGDRSNGWSGVSLPWMSIGYELHLTPLQVLKFYNAIANNGRLVKPYLVEKIVQDGQEVRTYGSKVIKERIASPESIAIIQDMLKGVVTEGTGKNVTNGKFTVAGKTGTAQTDYQKGDIHIGYQASFAGYFPAENPAYSMIVVIYNPDKSLGYYGSAVAGPVFREIAEKIYATKAINQEPINQQTPTWVTAKLPQASTGYMADFEYVFRSIGIGYESLAKSDWIDVNPVQEKVRFQDKGLEEGLVPDVRGMGVRDAVFILENAGLKVKVKGMGHVIRQSLKPGLEAKGQMIELTLD